MKRLSALVLSAAVMAGLILPAHGAEETAGYALYTDIVAQIDGRPIPSYNVGGRTAVMVPDLAWYGFYIYWDAEARTAYVWPESMRPESIGEREDPDYTPQPPEGKVGDPAYPIYASDVRVLVAGEEKESFNIGGHTLVYLSDLTAYGDLAWNEEARLAELTVTQDPVELAMQREETRLKGAGLSYYFNRYPGSHGTLAVYGQHGTPHGTSCMMLYVDQSGQQTRLDMLLPPYGFGTEYYLNPTEIQFDESGDQLTFVTPVKEILDWKAEITVKDWGETLCTFSTRTGEFVSMVPLHEELTD